jgi:CheY-like chemotaxis protein
MTPRALHQRSRPVIKIEDFPGTVTFTKDVAVPFFIERPHHDQASTNMTKRVLSVGQCMPDHSSISRLIRGNFDAEVVAADLPASAMAQLRAGPFDLVLINRKLDADYSDGLEILKAIKEDALLKTVPVMLVTNYPEHQQAAVAAGGEYGFGKQELALPGTVERLRKYLA